MKDAQDIDVSIVGRVHVLLPHRQRRVVPGRGVASCGRAPEVVGAELAVVELFDARLDVTVGALVEPGADRVVGAGRVG